MESTVCYAALVVSIWISLIRSAELNCTLPFYYDDVYISAEKGELKASSDMISEYPIETPSIPSLDFFCKEKRDNMYMLKSTEKKNIFGSLTRFYLCLEIHKITNATYYYYYRTGYYYAQDFVHGSQEGDPILDDVCTVDINPRTFIMLVRKESYEESLLNTTCPQDILAVFANVNVTALSGSQTYDCPGTMVDVCTDRTTIAFTYNDTCSQAKAMSSSGKYSCLFSTTIDGNNYMGVWNQDPTIDGTNNFQYSCISYSTSGDTLYATETPERCTTTTTPTDLGSATKGVTLVAWDIILRCPDMLPAIPAIPKEPVDLSWLYYLAGALALLFLFIFLFVLLFCLYKRYGCLCKAKRKRTIKLPLDDEAKINGKKHESSIKILTSKETAKEKKMTAKEAAKKTNFTAKAIADEKHCTAMEVAERNIFGAKASAAEKNSSAKEIAGSKIFTAKEFSDENDSIMTDDQQSNVSTDDASHSDRPDSHTGTMTDESVVTNDSSESLKSSSQLNDTTDICKQEEVKDKSGLSAIFKNRKIPIFFGTPRVNPMYTNTLDEYFENGVRRSKTEISLFRLDSGVFDEDIM